MEDAHENAEPSLFQMSRRSKLQVDVSIEMAWTRGTTVESPHQPRDYPSIASKIPRGAKAVDRMEIRLQDQYHPWAMAFFVV